MQTDTTTPIDEWIARIVEGPTGFESYERHEFVIGKSTTNAVAFALRCLANPKCEGADKVLNAIAEQRREAIAEARPQEIKDFEKLSSRERWRAAEKMAGVLWVCENCKHVIGETPPSAGIFEGAWVECENCGNELTRRTPGGQSNPFNMTFIFAP